MNGVELFDKGDVQEAYPLLEKEAASEEIPGLATLYLGSLQSKRSRDASFVREAAERVGTNVDRWLVLQVLGGTLFDIGLQEEGLSLLEQAVELEPSRKNIFVFASRLDDVDDRKDEALAIYDELLKQDSNDGSALIGRGLILADRGKWPKAEACLRRAVALLPQYPRAWYGLADVVSQKGDYTRAIECFEQALELGYCEPADVWASIAWCRLESGDSDGAIRAANEALTIDADHEYAAGVLEDAKALRDEGGNDEP